MVLIMLPRLQEKMAGEITLSENPGKTLRKWREIFQVSQKELSRVMGISPSMISDYESGRRKSPGTHTVRRFVLTLLDIDTQRGSEIIKKYTQDDENEAVISIGEFPESLTFQKFLDLIEGECVTNADRRRSIYGYTMIDSIKAITTLKASDYLKIYGWSSERALLFSGVSYGRSPMIAIRTHQLKPAMVVYLQPEKIDPLALRLAELEGVPLVITHHSMEIIRENLERLRI